MQACVYKLTDNLQDNQETTRQTRLGNTRIGTLAVAADQAGWTAGLPSAGKRLILCYILYTIYQ